MVVREENPGPSMGEDTVMTLPSLWLTSQDTAPVRILTLLHIPTVLLTLLLCPRNPELETYCVLSSPASLEGWVFSWSLNRNRSC